jgi:AcrR family transcriptional regulator
MTTRLAILKAADQMFAEHGYGLIGVDALAKAAGVTKRTLYKHFGSKAGLFQAWLELRDHAMRSALVAEVEKRATAPRDQVLVLFALLGSFASNPNYHGCPFSRALIELDDAMVESRAVAQRHKEAISDWFAGRIAAAGLADGDALCQELILLYEGTLQRVATSHSPDAAHAARRLIALRWPEDSAV